MLPITLKVKPGVDYQSTALQSEGSINECNLIRFKNGQIQKLGGNNRLSANTFTGVASAIMPWAALDDTQYIGIGTTTGLQLLSPGSITDVTPATGAGSGDWSLDKWGQDLVGAVSNGPLCHWVPPIAFGNIAIAVPNSPPVVHGLVVAAPQQQIITWGAYSLSLATQDPMLVRWCDVSDLTVWVASPTNQAGSFRIPSGSSIQAIQWQGLSGLLWTDLDLWTMTYIGFPGVYGFNRIAQNCGLIARRAVASLGTVTAWLSQNDFYVTRGGTPQVLPCSVRDVIFDNLDGQYTNNIHADANTYFDEIKWYFPTTGSAGVCNAYVKWNVTENLWDYSLDGCPNISAWTDQSVVGAPLGTDYSGYVQEWEASYDYDGAALNPYFQTGWFKLGGGQVSLFVERINPDFTMRLGSEVLITVTFADEVPEDDGLSPERNYGPYLVTQQTPFIIVRGSGRVARLRVESTALNTTWRYGEPLARVAPDGRAP